MQTFGPLRYDFHYIGGISNVITDSISSSSSSSSSSISSSSVHEGGMGGWSAPLSLKSYSPHLYYPFSTNLLILLCLQTFPKFAIFFYKRPFKPLNTLVNKV